MFLRHRCLSASCPRVCILPRVDVGLVAAAVVAAVTALAAPAGRAAPGEEGFGGSSPASGQDVEDAVCVVQTPDGRWQPCEAVLSSGSTEPAAEDPATRALRERMRALEEAERAAPNPEKKTQIEEEIERGKLDPTMPLLALRIEAARAQERVSMLEARGRGGVEREVAEAHSADVRAILDDVERIARHRMEVCSLRLGNKPITRSHRMTPGGPVLLTRDELIAQMPVTDPDGCSRILLMDATTVERVRRVHGLRKTLRTRSFGYHEVAERKAVEQELADLEHALARDTAPILSAPGVGGSTSVR